MADKTNMFEWKSAYSVGVKTVDGQHQNLFALSRELHEAMTKGQGKTAVERVLDRLVQYTVVHFAYEERLMRLYDYGDTVAHRAEHEALTKRVLAFQEDVHAGRATITVQLLQFLRDWLVNHIQHSDVKLAPFLKGKAVA